MIKPDQIPDEVVEALHSLFAWIGNSDGAREAIAAALNAWPQMHVGAPWVIGVPNAPSIILPLPQEGE